MLDIRLVVGPGVMAMATPAELMRQTQVTSFAGVKLAMGRLWLGDYVGTGVY